MQNAREVEVVVGVVVVKVQVEVWWWSAHRGNRGRGSCGGVVGR